jgi:hypothetical protein
MQWLRKPFDEDVLLAAIAEATIATPGAARSSIG